MIEQEINDYDVLHKSMWKSYEEIKASNYKMDGLEDIKRLEILEFFLLPYFVKYEYFEVAAEICEQVKTIKNKTI